jgi:3-methylcrotonyl-CoA carboxylase alpha subunit
VIESLLVANRGEIACRIFRTARRLGIRTIAVYSDVDAGARHVREADVAVCIGGAAARDSYLNIPKLLQAAGAARAQAVHPGYGFLSEHAPFATACKEAGLTFVGPPAEAIAAMASKIVAKARMRAAGVPVLPGYDGEMQDLADLEEQARRLPLPLIIKPAAGGGGKGMQIVSATSQIAPALAAARRLAQSAFGDGTLLLERFLAMPRHVEVQVFADTQGRTIHLGDRDCSVQRRHQKVIEEAPAPNIPPEVRERMRGAALLVAREIGYVGAGTVEFLFDAGEFYFMEMNTRLQVEHTVTEAITGLDLVEWQLRVAAGEPLPLEQAQIAFHGHAIEGRVCAEDPQRDFLPSSGHLQLLQWPSGESIRVDAGFDSGDEVPSSYDSLLGKVIAWASTRAQAAARLAGALDRTFCAGVSTNERWLARILRDEQFLAARHSVALLQESTSLQLAPSAPPPAALALAVLALRQARLGPPAAPWDITDGFVPNLPSTVSSIWVCGERRYEVGLTCAHGTPVGISIDAGPPLALADISVTPDEVAVRLGTVLHRAHYHAVGPRLHLWLEAEHFDLVRDDPRDRLYSTSSTRGGLTTPLPGVVVAVSVEPGQKVEAGEVLMVVEAMKMEHAIKAPRAGVVRAVHCAPGDRVPEGKALLEIGEISGRNAAE